MTNVNLEKSLSPKQIQEMTGAAPSVVWNWIREHKIPAKKFGRAYIVAEEDFKKFWLEYKPTFEKYQKIRASIKK